MKFNIILAVDEKNWIWKSWELAWKISEDMKYFKKITETTKDLGKLNWVIMWRKTWVSIPSKYRPLENRINCILSRKLKYEDIHSKIDNFVLHFNDFEHCLKELNEKENLENIFLIGWADLYNQFVNHPNLEKIYLTQVSWDFDCDVHFKWIPESFKLETKSELKEENWVEFRFQIYKKA